MDLNAKDFAAAVSELVQRIDAAFHEAELDRQSLRRARSGRDIERYDAQVAELGFEVAALGVDVADADAGDQAVGLFPAVDADAAVTRPVGAMEIAVESFRVANRVGEILVLRLEFLHAHEIGALPGKPAKEAFIDGRTYAV